MAAVAVSDLKRAKYEAERLRIHCRCYTCTGITHAIAAEETVEEATILNSSAIIKNSLNTKIARCWYRFVRCNTAKNMFVF